MKNVYGCLFRQIRTQKGFSLESLAKGIGLSKGTLWEAEQGKRNLSLATFKAGLHFMNVSYTSLKKSKEEITHLIKNFIHACYFGDRKEAESVERQFLELHFDRHQTFHDLYYHLLILEALIDVNKKDQSLYPKVFEAVSLLEKVAFYFCDGLKELYHCLIVSWLSYDNRIIEVEKYLENIFSFNAKEIYPHVQGLIGYQFLRSTIHNRSMHQALKLIAFLRALYQQDMNYVGLIHLDNLEGICFLLVEEYEEAVRKFQAVIRNIELFCPPDHSLRVEGYNNLLWGYLMKEDYSKALEVANLFENLFGCAKEGKNLIFAIYCEYRLGHLAQALQRLKKMEKALASSKSFYDPSLLEVFQALLQQSPKSFEAVCEKVLSQLIIKDRFVAEFALFLLKTLLFEAERLNQSKKAYLLRQRMALLRHKIT